MIEDIAMKFVKVDVFGACFNGGDGSVSIRWYLSEEKADEAEEAQD